MIALTANMKAFDEYKKKESIKIKVHGIKYVFI
jgi:hypothetical protein